MGIMHIKISALLQLALLSITCFSMEKPLARAAQPPSLRYLAASLIARQINPANSYPTALRKFSSPLMNNNSVTPLIKDALCKQAQSQLTTILKSQVPLSLAVERFDQYPAHLYPLTTHGLYVRTKKEGYDPDCPDPLYQDIAKLIPDPLNQNAPTQFFEVYSNPNGTKYFDDDDDQWRTPENSRGMCIWDTSSGAFISNGSEIQKKIRKRFPALSAADPEFPDLLLYGLCPTDMIAWARFVYLSDNQYKNGTCAFNIADNSIILLTLDNTLSLLRHSGKLSAIKENNNNISSVLLAGDPSKIALSCNEDASTIWISPCDNYALCNVSNEQAVHVIDFTTSKRHQLTIEGKPFYLGNGIYNPLNSDGSLMAVLQGNQIYLLKVLTNELICTLPAPLPETDDTFYNLLFSPDSKHLLALKVKEGADDVSYNLTVFDIASQQCVEELTQEQITHSPYATDFIFCNGGDYLLLPNGQLRIQPQGLAHHLSLKELLGLLILENQKTNNVPIDSAIFRLLQQNPLTKIRDLMQSRYPLSK
ncbi:hypothetical protein BH09DEP1_BH09DEP1_0150 [soil metagenome]